ncbi:hypothetical protein [Exiguobacterium sp. s150]|uniref:hypothetical protein n=1 Tax=Exiguobacterium sp. s150 TaxID=2751221 RepID=UPI001BE73ACA|nr:hypothetical protein [Exiguobacterium sp. s150]
MSWVVGIIGYFAILAIVYYGVLFFKVKQQRSRAGYRIFLLLSGLFLLSGSDYIIALFQGDTEATFWQRTVYFILILISLSVALYFRRKEDQHHAREMTTA